MCVCATEESLPVALPNSCRWFWLCFLRGQNTMVLTTEPIVAGRSSAWNQSPASRKKTASERRLFSLLSVLRGLEPLKRIFKKKKKSDFFKLEFFSEF